MDTYMVSIYRSSMFFISKCKSIMVIDTFDIRFWRWRRLSNRAGHKQLLLNFTKKVGDMEDKSWIKLYRKILKSPIWENEKALKVWIWCLVKATHEERIQLVGQQEVLLQKGQFVQASFLFRQRSVLPGLRWPNCAGRLKFTETHFTCILTAKKMSSSVVSRHHEGNGQYAEPGFPAVWSTGHFPKESCVYFPVSALWVLPFRPEWSALPGSRVAVCQGDRQALSFQMSGTFKSIAWKFFVNHI